MTDSLPDSLARRLERQVRTVQRDCRVPGIAAGVVRAGELVWTLGVGAGDIEAPDAAPTPETAFAIGSISKTFTAALVMMLRDEGRLSLGDRLAEHVPGHRHDRVTLRELLGHASGLQREPVGDPWDTLVFPPVAEVVASLDTAEQVLPARRRWHYSNLAYALLGEVVSRVSGRPLPELLQSRLLDPLGMARTAAVPTDPRAVGYFTDPFTDEVHREPWPEMGAFGAAGGLWSTVSDLAHWAAGLTDGVDGVLPASTVEEMTRPEIMADLDEWTHAAGLGLQLFRSGERVLVGHSGSMPGFLAALVARRRERTAAIVLANSSAGVDPTGLAIQMLDTVLHDDPPAAETWRPGPPVPAALRPLLGRWWSEGDGFTFTVRGGRLEARADGAPATRAPAVFEPDGVDRFRGVSGREEGELLRVERGADGAVTRLVWAGYAVTREPRGFGS